MLVYNVIKYDFNSKKFEPYNIFLYLEKKYKKDPPKDTFRETLKQWILNNCKYEFWCRCEYELILTPWPPNSDIAKKIDIYWQVEMNIDAITDIMYINLKNLK